MRRTKLQTILAVLLTLAFCAALLVPMKAQESTLRSSLAGAGNVRPQDFGALGGAHDDTTAFQSAFTFAAQNSVTVLIPPGRYTVSSVLFMSNNVALTAYGAAISNSAASGYTVEWGSATNVVWQGGRLVGGPVPNDGTQNTTPGSLSGFHILANSAGSRIEDVTCQGFSDAGFRVFGTEGNTVTPYTQKITMLKCEAVYDYFGIETTSTDASDDAEYVHIIGFQEMRCNYGIHVRSGNILVLASRFNNDVVGADVSGGDNGAHGAFVGCSFNHNVASAVTCSAFENGEMFDSCEFLAGGAISITNCSGVVFRGGTMSVTTIYVVGGGAHAGVNWIRDGQYYSGSPSIIGGFPTITSINGGIMLVDEGNQSEAALYNYNSVYHAPKPMGGMFMVYTNQQQNFMQHDTLPDGSLMFGTTGAGWVKQAGYWTPDALGPTWTVENICQEATVYCDYDVDAQWSGQANGTAVSSLIDYSGHGYLEQAQGGFVAPYLTNNPFLCNGRYGAMFGTGGSVGMNTNFVQNWAQPLTWFIVCTLPSNNSGTLFAGTGGTNVQIFNSSGSTYLNAGSQISCSTPTGPLLLEAYANNTTSQLKTNGSVAVSGTVGASGEAYLILGANSGGGNNGTFMFWRMIGISGALTAVNSNAIVNHLIGKYGLTNMAYRAAYTTNALNTVWYHADATNAPTDRLVQLDGAHSTRMPPAGIPGLLNQQITVMCMTAGTNAILPNGSEVFLGKGTITASKWTNSAPGNATTFQSNGTNWIVIKTDN